jgi:hypothetical protein
MISFASSDCIAMEFEQKGQCESLFADSVFLTRNSTKDEDLQNGRITKHENHHVIVYSGLMSGETCCQWNVSPAGFSKG